MGREDARDGMAGDGFGLWLGSCVARWSVEARALLGPALSSPESAMAVQSEGSWARAVFPCVEGDWREFDRAALSLRCLWTLREQGSLESLKAQADPAWAGLLAKVVGKSGGLDALAYATLFNDLGKLDSTARALAQAGQRPPVDHDEALLQATLHASEAVCPGFMGLGEPWITLWREGMSSAFNPGMAIQMEMPRAGWDPWLRLSPQAREFHALHCYFDVLGADGAKEPLTPTPLLGSGAFSRRFYAACFAPGPQQFEEGMATALGLEGARRPALAAAMSARCASPERARACAKMLGAMAQGAQDAQDALGWLWGEESLMACQYASALLAADSGDEGLREGLGALARAAASLRELAKPRAVGEHGGAVEVANIARMATLRALGDPRWRRDGLWKKMEGGWSWSEN